MFSNINSAIYTYYIPEVTFLFNLKDMSICIFDTIHFKNNTSAFSLYINREFCQASKKYLTELKKFNLVYFGGHSSKLQM